MAFPTTGYDNVPALRDSYLGKGNQPLAFSDTGQAWKLFDYDGVAAQALESRLQIINGRVTTAVNSGAPSVLGYKGLCTANVGNRVKRIRGTFTFSPYSTPTGSIVLLVFLTDPTLTYPAIPNGAIHLAVSPESFSFSLIEGGVPVNPITGAVGGFFTNRLKSDNDTVHELVVDIFGSTAVITMPSGVNGSDNKQLVINDPRIDLYNGGWPCWEVYQSIPATDSKGKFLTLEADSDTPQPTPVEIGTVGAPAFENGWHNSGGGYARARYWRDQDGDVHLEGVVANAATGATAFTLPVGFRPAEHIYTYFFTLFNTGALVPQQITSGTNLVFRPG